MKFYVYVEKVNDEITNYIFVDDLNKFVTHSYKPCRMSFTGVVIDACDVFAAKKAYDAPYESDLATTVAWIPEPPETANYSMPTVVEEQPDVLDHMLRCSIIAVEIAKALQKCNLQLAELAHHIRTYNKKNPAVAKEDVYKRLKERYIEHFKRLRYKPYTPSES